MSESSTCRRKQNLVPWPFYELELKKGSKSFDDFMHAKLLCVLYWESLEGGKGGVQVGSRSRFTENKLVLSQFTRNKILHSTVHEKWHFWHELTLLVIFRRLRLVRCLYQPPASRSACCEMRSEQEHEEEWFPCRSHTILLITVENNRRHNENRSSRRIKKLCNRMELHLEFQC